MVTLKFLVTGSAGLIGNQLVNDLSKSHDVISCYNNSKPEFGIPMNMDLQNHEMISNILRETKPDVVIHLGAMTNVDLCEDEQLLASKINTKATQIISEECSKLNSFLVYVSTDYVFDGKSGKYKEDDVTNPIGFYGKSKLDGEYAVQKFSSNWCIARTSTPFGYHSSKKSFPVWLIENLQNNKSVNILTDQITSPTYVPNLSSMLMEISQKKIEGIIHVSGATKISRFDFASLIVEKLNLDKNLLKPIKMDEINFKAKRPKNSSLDVSKATAILSEKPESVEQSLEKFIEKKNDNE